MQSIAFETKDFAEGKIAFRERRKPGLQENRPKKGDRMDPIGDRINSGKRKHVRNSDLVLKDIRIIDIGAVLPLPLRHASGDFGAEVIKIEPLDVPDAFVSGMYWKADTSLLAVNARNKLPLRLTLSILREENPAAAGSQG